MNTSQPATYPQGAAPKRPSGMLGFTVVWAGQIVSVLATNMTAFVLTIWVFEKTQSATALALMGYEAPEGYDRSLVRWK